MKSRPGWMLIASGCLLAGCGNEPGNNVVVGEFASDRIELTAEVNEPVVEIRVAEGAAVTAGQVLLRQNSRRAEARLAEAEAAAGQAQARLDELVRGPRSEQIAAARAGLEGAIDEREFRETDFERVQRIHELQLASPDLLDRARTALQTARANEDLRRAQLAELLSGTTVEELSQAQYALEQAEARRDLARVDLERHATRAPVDGIVDSRLFEIGERPAAGQPLIVMLGGTQPYARIYVPETVRVGVGPGMPVRMLVDGLDEPLRGTVRWVASEAAFTPYFALTERDRGRLSYEAKVDVAFEGDRLPDGVPVEVQLGPAGD